MDPRSSGHNQTRILVNLAHVAMAEIRAAGGRDPGLERASTAVARIREIALGREHIEEHGSDTASRVASPEDAVAWHCAMEALARADALCETVARLTGISHYDATWIEDSDWDDLPEERRALILGHSLLHPESIDALLQGR